MHYFIFPDKDTTLYEASSSINAGMDEILEIRKDVNDAATIKRVSRALLKFDLNHISQSVSDGKIPKPNLTGSRYFLNLFDAHPTSLAMSQSLYAYPVSQSWNVGDGKLHDDPVTTEGTSWIYKDGKADGTLWYSPMSSSGATWHSGSGYEASQSLNNETRDIRMDVTDIVNTWFAGTVPNEGFIVKRRGSVGNTDSGSDEGSSDRLGNLAFFSRDTHTKYPPTLEVVWDDSTWTTSLSELTGSALEDVVIYMKGLRPKYNEKSKVRFRLVGRERFPTKTYSTTPSNLTVKYLPSGSTFYSIRDAETDDVIVPFGSGSKVSCDGSGNYFNVWLDGYQPERYYRLLFRFISGSGTVHEIDQIFDEGHSFKVSR